MYLASFSYRDTERIGARIDDGHLIDFRDAADALDRSWDYATMLDLIAGGAEAQVTASRLLDAASASPEVERIPIADIVWHPPVPRPGKICGVALNNSASDARKISSPDHPMFFLKPSTCLVGHLQPIVARTQYMGFHPEPELGVVISTLARNVDPSKAMAHVYGYTIFNDVTGKWDGRLPPPDVRRPEGLRWTLAGRRHQSAKWEEQALHRQTGGSEMKIAEPSSGTRRSRGRGRSAGWRSTTRRRTRGRSLRPTIRCSS